MAAIYSSESKKTKARLQIREEMKVMLMNGMCSMCPFQAIELESLTLNPFAVGLVGQTVYIFQRRCSLPCAPIKDANFVCIPAFFVHFMNYNSFFPTQFGRFAFSLYLITPFLFAEISAMFFFVYLPSFR